MAKSVHDMFDSIAHRYDVANDVLSGGTHRLWRRCLLKHAALQPGGSLLDLCTGTGEVARAGAKLIGQNGRVVGVDFVEKMLELARQKPTLKDAAPIEYVQSDASLLPFREASFDSVTMAYGIRNVDSPLACLREIRRVLKDGGRAAILEFGQPSNFALCRLFGFYCNRVMPAVGELLTGNRAAYEYLPRTSALFPAGEKFLAIMREAGFKDPKAVSLFGGIAYVYLANCVRQ